MRLSFPINVVAAVGLLWVVSATLVAGCGGGGNSPAEARLAALANHVCSVADDVGLQAGLRTDLAMLRAQVHSDRELPRVARYLADVQASARIQARSTKAHKQYGDAASTLLKESSQLKRKVQSDLKALGWTRCPPAHDWP